MNTTTARPPQTLCRAGVARDDITPPVGIYHRMWGAARHDRATGIHRPLTATVACLAPVEESEPAPWFVIALDHCLLWHTEQSRLLTELERRTGIPQSQIVLAYSHTHSAGLMDLSRTSLPGGELIAPYLERLAGILARLIEETRSHLIPAVMEHVIGRCDLAAERDFPDPVTGQIVCGFHPGVPADDTVVVGRLSRLSGEPLATLVNYACHPTTLAWENTLISPDYPGAMREVVEQVTGVPCLFLQGASGDLGPREGFVGDPAVADRNGRQLGYAVVSALESLGPVGCQLVYRGAVVSGATLGVWDWKPLGEAESRQASRVDRVRETVPLAYRPELPTVDDVEGERARWLAQEADARARGDSTAERDAHAMVERMDRQLTRLAVLPAGPLYPFLLEVWRWGDVVWVLLEGEPYQSFQQILRQRYPGTTIMVITLANGARCSYLPPISSWGRKIYQESIALLAPGCLEQVTEAAVRAIGRLLAR
ncbi:MAG TPA: hypothetical protein DDY91_07955 [Planctomycetaceae bacterium]|nr:hypothetical protein [Planctomycetaceae bacterium]